jgi:hypothetical protein
MTWASDNGDRFAKGTSLTQIIELYEFDRAMRSLLFEYVGIIEIQARTLMTRPPRYGAVKEEGRSWHETGTMQEQDLRIGARIGV